METCLLLTNDQRDFIRESFLSVFVYLPIIMEDSFEPYVYSAIDGIVESISHNNEGIRNLAIKSIKILIRRFLQKSIGKLVTAFTDGVTSANPTKQNSSLILLGDIIDMLHEESKNKDSLYQDHPRLLSIFYVLKNDVTAQVRNNASNIFKTFVDNTQRCLKIILNDLIEFLVGLFNKGDQKAMEIAEKGLQDFTPKYGEGFITQILNSLTYTKNQSSEKDKRGICLFVKSLATFCRPSGFSETRKLQFYELLYNLFNEQNEGVWKVAAQGLRVVAETSKDVKLIEEVLLNYFPGYQDYDVGHPRFEKLVQLFCEFLKSQRQEVTFSTIALLVKDPLREWNLEVFMRNCRLFGTLLYNGTFYQKGLLLNCEQLDQGVTFFMDALEVESSAR